MFTEHMTTADEKPRYRQVRDLTAPTPLCLGCGASVSDRICCDACWKRVPRDLPNWPYWRSKLKTARQINAWEWIEGIVVAVRTWLLEHPARSTTSDGSHAHG